MAPTNERPATNRDAMQEVPRTLFGYVERTLGDDGLDRLLALLGKEPGLDAFIARHPRFTNSEIRAMVDAAATVCGEHDMGRRLGQEAFWYNIERNSARSWRRPVSLPVTRCACSACPGDLIRAGPGWWSTWSAVEPRGSP